MRYETESNNLTIQNTENGYLSKIILKGKTLVNNWTVDRYDVILSNNITSLVTKETTSNSCKLTINSNLTSITESNWRILQAYPKKWCLNKIKPNTRYTAFFNLETNKLNMSTNFRLCKNDGTEDLSSSVEFTTKNGLIRAEFQTLSTLPTPTSEHHFYLSCNELRDAGDYMKLSNVCIFEGVVENISNYVDGVKSVGNSVDNIVISTKNSDISQEVLNDKRVLLYKNKDGVWKKTILRSISANVRDIVEETTTGKYVYRKRCGEITLKGTEDFVQNNEANNKFSALIDIKDIKMSSRLHSEYYNGTHAEISENVKIGTFVRSNRKCIVVCEDTTNMEGFKNIMKKKNPTFVYELEQEEVYECTPIGVASFKDETTWKIESGAISPNSSFETDYTFSNAVVRVKDAKLFNQAMTDNLRQNLIDKDVEVSLEDKISNLIDKVGDIVVEKHTFPKWADENEFYVSCNPNSKSYMQTKAYQFGKYLYFTQGSGADKMVYKYDIDKDSIDSSYQVVNRFAGYGPQSTFCKANNSVYVPDLDGSYLQEHNPETNTLTNYTCPNYITDYTRKPYAFSIGNSIFIQVTSGYNYPQVEFNILTKTFTDLPSCPYHLTGLMGCYAVGNNIYYLCQNYIIEYNTLTKTFTQYYIPFIHKYRQYMVFDKFKNRLYFFGGKENSTYFKDVFYFNLSTKTFVSCTEMPIQRESAKVWVTDGGIYVLGGYKNSSDSVHEVLYFTNLK